MIAFFPQLVSWVIDTQRSSCCFARLQWRKWLLPCENQFKFWRKICSVVCVSIKELLITLKEWYIKVIVVIGVAIKKFTFAPFCSQTQPWIKREACGDWKFARSSGRHHLPNHAKRPRVQLSLRAGARGSKETAHPEPPLQCPTHLLSTKGN